MTEETGPRFFYCFLSLSLALQFSTAFFTCVFLVGFYIVYGVNRQMLPLKRGRCSLLVLAGTSHKAVLVSNKRQLMSLLIFNGLHFFFFFLNWRQPFTASILHLHSQSAVIENHSMLCLLSPTESLLFLAARRGFVNPSPAGDLSLRLKFYTLQKYRQWTLVI